MKPIDRKDFEAAEVAHCMQVQMLEDELRAVMHRIAAETDLTVSDTVGALQILIMELYGQYMDKRQQEDDEQEWTSQT